MKTKHKTFLADDVIAAAIAAFRINNNKYVKEFMVVELYDHQTQAYYANPEYKKKNSILVREFMDDATSILEEDRKRVDEIKKFVQQHLTIKILKNSSLDEFDNMIMAVVNGEQISEKFLSIAAYIPALYDREIREYHNQDRLDKTDNCYLGEPNSKIQSTIEIVRYHYSQNYRCFFANAISSDNKRVFFAYSGSANFQVGKQYMIKATVKRHDANFTTVLSRVKLVET